MVDLLLEKEEKPAKGEDELLKTFRSFTTQLESGNSVSNQQLSDTRFITYKIIDDIDGKLKRCTRIACNFWNLFVQPKTPVVIRIGTFDAPNGIIARAWEPDINNGITYGQVEFSLYFLSKFSEFEIAGTIVHEIGHVLGFGWNIWDKMFTKNNGKFKQAVISKLQSLQKMEVEIEGQQGTIYSHWDEDKFGGELMTGYKGSVKNGKYIAAEHVLPVTIDVLELFGHRIISRLRSAENLDDLLRKASSVQFSRQQTAKSIDLDFKVTTDIMETIPHPGK